MRIVIDLQGAQTGSRFRGIGRYSLSLAKAIVRNRGDHEVIVALSGLFPDTIESIRDEFDDLLPQENIRIWYAPSPVLEREPDNTWRREAAERIRETFLASLKPDFVLLSSLFEGYDDEFVASVGVLAHWIPTAVVFFDLIPLFYIDTYLPQSANLAWYQRKINYCKRTQLLLSISESSRQEALKILGLMDDSVVNISAAVDSQFRPRKISVSHQKQLRLKFGLQNEYLMYSGATDFRKNHLRLIGAYAKLPRRVRSKHQLALVGGMTDDLRNRFLKPKKCGLKKDEIIITGRVTDDEMTDLYNLCKAFVFPSWHEGFGLPVLEAMKCGRAVIASNTSSLPEVVGNPDALFNPFDEHCIAMKIEHVLTNDLFRAELEQHGLERSKTFSWDATSKRAISAIEVIHMKNGATQKTYDHSRNNDTLLSSLIKSIAELSAPFDDDDLIRSAKAIAENFPSTQQNARLQKGSVLKVVEIANTRLRVV